MKAYLIVSEDRGRISRRMESVYSSIVLVALRMFATAEMILSYEIPILKVRAALLT